MLYNETIEKRAARGTPRARKLACLGWGGEDGPDGGKVGFLELVDLGHLDACVGQFFHTLCVDWN